MIVLYYVRYIFIVAASRKKPKGCAKG
jgi:hypothetical protein